MNQSLKKVTNINNHENQFQYLDRWVDKANFRAFVYDKDGKERIANSHKEFETLTTNGLWFASKPYASKVERKQKNVALPDSK